MTQISEIWGLHNALENKAPNNHRHRIPNIDGLKEALAGKAPLEHEHALATAEEAGYMSAADKVKLDNLMMGGSGDGEIFISSVSGLGEALDEKAAVDELTGLQVIVSQVQSLLADKASVAAVAAVEQGLAGKASTGAVAVLDTAIANVIAALNGKANTDHNHAIAQVLGLQTILDAKASKSTATASQAGLMSAADKTKLDGISSSGGSINLNPQALTYEFSQSSAYNAQCVGSFANMTDGNLTTGAGTTSAASSWLKADLGAIKIVSQIKLGGGGLTGFGNTSTYLNGAILECSTDDQNWLVINPSVSGITDTASILFAVGHVVARYVRLRRTNTYIGACELQIYG